MLCWSILQKRCQKEIHTTNQLDGEEEAKASNRESIGTWTNAQRVGHPQYGTMKKWSQNKNSILSEKDLNVIHESVKLTEDNRRKSKRLCENDDILDTTPRAWSMHDRKIDKLGSIKIKNFCSMKDIVNQLEREATIGGDSLQNRLTHY